MCIILPTLLPFGGAERLAMTLAQDQIDRGHKVDLVLMNEPKDVSGDVPEGVRVFNLNAPRLRNALNPLSKYLKTEQPNVGIAFIWPLTVLSILAKAFGRSKTRIIVSDHNPLSIQYKDWGFVTRMFLKLSIWLSYRFADGRICVSEGVANNVSQLAGLPVSHMEVIYNPIALPVSTAKGRAVAEKLWDGWTGPRLLTLGRCKAQKNHKLLLDAFKIFLENTEAKLMILGTGPLEDQTKAYAVEQGLEASVIMPGHVSSPAEYYECADVFVLSSDYEGFGNVIVEAMSFGLPIASTDCPAGPSEILNKGEYGELATIGNAAELADAMRRALKRSPDIAGQKRRAIEISGADSLQKYNDIFFNN